MTEIPGIYLDLLLEKKAFAHLATVMPDGSPQNTPVWFDFTDGKIRVNSALGRTKVRNMKLGAKVALSIMDPDNPDRYVQTVLSRDAPRWPKPNNSHSAPRKLRIQRIFSDSLLAVKRP